MEKGRKFSKLAIVTFILAIINVLLIFIISPFLFFFTAIRIGTNYDYSLLDILTKIVSICIFILPIIIILLSIISFILILIYKLRGRWLIIVSLLISMFFMLANSTKWV